MFDSPGPHVFGLAPGVDFPAELVAGLLERYREEPPEALARVTLIVNTARMRRRIKDILTLSGARLLPRIQLVTELVDDPLLPLPKALGNLRIRLELVRLISKLLELHPDLAPRSALFDLADSLAELMDEMQGENVHPDVLVSLDVADHSAHWARALSFIKIVLPYFEESASSHPEALQRLAVQERARRWAMAPPPDPVIVAGSTGSRGATLALMTAVSMLPKGALVLPGFDFNMPGEIWSGLRDALTAEDHPQFRFRKLLDQLGTGPDAVRPWTCALPPNADRNRLISLSLRPAPVTDQWRAEGETLCDLVATTREMTLVEAPSPRAEACTIALILRNAIEDGRKAALISPDRVLTRQVAAALDRWGIIPDDSAGQPLSQSAPGRLLLHLADACCSRLSAEDLFVLLKHPITHSGCDRGQHLLFTRDLELHIRRNGPAFPDVASLRSWKGRNELAGNWAEWIARWLEALSGQHEKPLTSHVADHLALAETLAAGTIGAGSGGLWDEDAGQVAQETMQELLAESVHGGSVTAMDYRDLCRSILSAKVVRSAVKPRPDVLIWGTLEARVQGADLVVLGGLNEGAWPTAPTPDPWLNRSMRLKAGLLLPERRIGLAAHDYQQAIGAPEVVLTRSVRDSEAETTPSRWLNRLSNLMAGLPQKRGPVALAEMRERGATWLRRAEALESPAEDIPRAHRPSPSPPVHLRPKTLPVTQIARLIRDPYSVYARYILRLFPLQPLRPRPDARERGSVLHRIMERYAARGVDPRLDRDGARSSLLAAARETLDAEVPWASARVMWYARLERVADWFVEHDAGTRGTPVILEEQGSLRIDRLGFQLTARPDRIDRLDDGRVCIIDYKTGKPPTEQQVLAFEKQLVLEAVIASNGGFPGLGRSEVSSVRYVGLGSAPTVVEIAVNDQILQEQWSGLERLLACYSERAQGYTARRALDDMNSRGDYDHLSRLGEWEPSEPPKPEFVGREATE